MAAMHQRGLELKGEVDRQESRIHFNEERLKELEAQNSKALGDISQAEERQRIATDELSTVIDTLSRAESALAAHRQALQEKQENLREIEEDLRQSQEDLRQAQAEAFAAAQDLGRVRNEMTALDLQKQGNLVRLEKLSAEKIQLEEERTRLELRLAEFAASVEAEKLNAQTQRGTVEERQDRLRQLHAELAEVSQQQDEVLRHQAEKRSRLGLLEQLQAGHEGFSEGALAALKQSELVLGSLADRIRVPDNFVTAVETALGHHLQLVLTEQPESAHHILADLSAGAKGRASVAALGLTCNGSGAVEEAAAVAPAELNGVPLDAVAVVHAEPGIRPLVRRLLGTTRIVRDLEAATADWRATGGAFDYVTLAGEVLSRHGVYTGGKSNGSSGGKAAASILARKNQIAELQAVLNGLQETVGEVSRRKGALQSEQTELQASLQQAQSELREQEVAIATHQGEYNALQNSQRLLHQKIETVVFEVQSLAAQEEEALQKRGALEARAGESEALEQSRQHRVTELTAGLETLRAARDVATATLNESRIALAADEQLRQAGLQQKQSLELRLRELTQIVEQRRGEISSFLTRKASAETETQEARTRIERFQHEREQVNAQTAELVGLRQEQDNDITSREEALREQRRILAETQARRGALEVELAQKQMGVQNLRERVQQKYHLNLDDIRSECITITLADEGPAKVHVLTPEEMAASGAGTDWEAVA